MKVLHYALGFPPYRSGGLTKYVWDLMQEQVRQGEEVGLLWPGSYSVCSRKNWVEEHGKMRGIRNFELHNPLPVPLLDGVRTVAFYTKKGNVECYRELLKQWKPDILHVHTFMGLHKECLEAAEELGISVLYSAHDYFPLCPRATLFCAGSICEGMGEGCVHCNREALPFWKIFMLQSSVYRRYKDTAVVQKIRARHKRKYTEDVKAKRKPKREESEDSYRKLQEHYRQCMRQVAHIHYGSQVAAQRYRSQGILLPGSCIPMTHGGIADHRRIRKVHSVIQFAFLADLLPYKGFSLLCEALDEVWESGKRNFVLHIYSRNRVEKPYLIRHEPYRYKDIGKVLKEVDMVLTPSVWEETFGFTVLEALSYGVPVLASEHVGAKELLNEEGRPKGILIPAEKEHLKEAVLRICSQPEELEEYNKYICDGTFEYGMERHCRDIGELYSRILKEKNS